MTFDPELLRRLDAHAFTNAMVREGKATRERVVLAPNLDAAGQLDPEERASVRFRLERRDRQGDLWTLLGVVEDAAAPLRFLVDVEVEGQDPFEDGRVDASDAPGFALAFRRHPDLAGGERARTAFAARWQLPAEAAAFAAVSPDPVEAGALVMGAQLSRTPGTYGVPGSGDWYLLKCDRPGPFFIGFHHQTGEAEMFLKRFDAGSARFAVELLKAIT